MFSDWVCLVGVVLALFFHRAASSGKCLLVGFCGWDIMFCPVPLEYLHWTGFNTCAVCNTGIPVDSDHCAANAEWDQFFTPRLISCLDFFIFCSFFCSAGAPPIVEVLSISVLNLAYHLMIPWKVWIYWHSLSRLIKFHIILTVFCFHHVSARSSL